MPAGIGRKYVGDMFAKIGSMTPTGRRLSSAAAAAPPGMVTADALRMVHMKSGKSAVGYGAMGASGISMLSTSRSTGNYKPAPMTSAPAGIGRYA